MKYNYLHIIVCCFLFQYCSLFDGNQTIVENYAQEFELDFREVLTSNSNQFHFLVTHLKEYECKDAELRYSKWIHGSKIDLHIQDIKNPDPCISETYFPNAMIPAYEITQGSYQVQLTLPNSFVNNGILSNLDDRYLFHFTDQNGIKLKTTSLFKIPKNLIWGYVGTKNGIDKKTVDEFMIDLTLQSEKANIQAGNYGYFKFNKDSEILLEHLPSDLSNMRSFLVKHTDKFALRELRTNYHEKYGENLQISMYTSDGDIWDK